MNLFRGIHHKDFISFLRSFTR